MIKKDIIRKFGSAALAATMAVTPIGGVAFADVDAKDDAVPPTQEKEDDFAGKTVDELEEMMTDAEENVDKLTEIRDEKKAEKNENKASYDAALVEKEKADKAVKNAENALEEAKAENQKKLDDANQKVTDAESAKEEAEKEKVKADQDLEDAKTELETAKKAKTEKETVLTAVEKSEAEKANAAEKAQKDFETAQKAVEDAQAKVDKAQAKVDKLGGNLTELETAVENAKAEQKEAEKKIDEAKAKIDQAQKAKEKAEADLEEAKKNENVESANVKAAETKVNETKTNLDNAKVEKNAADKALVTQTGKVKDAETNLSNAKKEKTELDKKLEAEKAAKKTADNRAKEKAELLKKAEAEHKKEVEKKVALQGELAELNKQTIGLEKKVNDAKTEQQKAETKVNEAENKLKAAEEAAENSAQKIMDGAFAFFADLAAEGDKDAQDALNILNDEFSKECTQKGVEEDATNVVNMAEAIDLIKEGNDLRREYHGLSDLKINSKLMAIAMTNANWSSYRIAHSGHGGMWENLSWNTEDPYFLWYWIEKVTYYKQNNMKLTPDLVEVTKDPTYIYFKENGMLGETGHYTNLINEIHTTTGFGIAQYYGDLGMNSNRCDAQEFNGLVEEEGISVEEYEHKFLDWFKKNENPVEYVEKAEKAVEEAKAEKARADKALADAQSKLDAHKEVVKGKTDEIKAQQGEIDKAVKKVDDAKAVKNSADQAVTDAQNKVDAAKAASENAADKVAAAKTVKDDAVAKQNKLKKEADKAKGKLETAEAEKKAAEEKLASAKADETKAKADKEKKQREKNEAETTLNNANASLTAAQKDLTDKKKAVQVAEKKLQDAKNNQSQEIKQAQDELDAAKAELEKAKTGSAEKKKAKDQADNELKEAQQNTADAKKSVNEAIDQIALAEKNVDEKTQAVTDAASEVVEAENSIKDAKAAVPTEEELENNLVGPRTEHRDAVASKKAIEQKIAELNTLIEILDRELNQAQLELDDAEDYFVRVSDAYEARFQKRVMEDEATGIKVEAEIAGEAKLKVVDTGSTMNVILKDQFGKDYEILGNYDIVIEGTGTYLGDLKITIPVGTQYNGMTVVVKHLRDDGVVESFERKVVDGQVTVELEELSPVSVGIKKAPIVKPDKDKSDAEDNKIPTKVIGKTDEKKSPKTGDTDPMTAGVAGMLAAMGLGLAISGKRKEDNH